MNHREDGHHWEQSLGELLEELSDVQDKMLELLTRKRERMAAGDVDGMQAMQQLEQELADRLQKCHQRRARLLEAARVEGLPSDSLQGLASAVAGPASERSQPGVGGGAAVGVLGKRVKEVAGRMRLLQHQSLTNWVLAQRSLLHVSQMLEIVASGGRLQPTYGTGESPSRGFGGSGSLGAGAK